MVNCPYCGKELYEVTPANRQTGTPATYRCINPGCPLSRNTNNRSMADLLNEAVQEKRRLRGREWEKVGEQTNILCPHCGRVHLQKIGGGFRCPDCGEEYESEDDLSEARRTAVPRRAKWVRRAGYRAERVGIRQKHPYWWTKRKYWDEARKAKRKHLGIPKALKTTEAIKSNITTANVLTAFIFVGMGVALAAAMGNVWFMLAFYSVGLFALIPAPPEYTGPPVAWGDLNFTANVFWHSSHHGLAFIRSMAKISAIICFAMAFRDIGGVFNIPMILVAFMGYFSLKIRYNRRVPGELMESLLRFGFLGAYFIPFMIFSSIFESWVLVVIAFAFFAIPPIPEDKEGAMLTVQTDFFLKVLFAVLMFIALFGSGALAPLGFQPEMFGAGWGLKGAMAYTFIYFWVISGIGGFFTPSDSRPVIGFVMILGATVIWGLGPGSQEVGSALLGQWWPTVHNVFNTIAEPLTDMFGAISQTFGNAFLMITNPVAYAHQVMDGTYGQTAGTDSIGPIGIRITDFRIGTGMNDIYAEQPFQLMFTLKNEGGFDAKGVSASIYTDLEYNVMKHVDISESRATDIIEADIKIGRGTVVIGELFGVSAEELEERYGDKAECITGSGCREYVFYAEKKDAENELAQQDMRSFVMGGTLGCGIVEKADLREKFIPISVMVNYSYEVESSLQIEFLSRDEWDRRAKAGTLAKKTEVSSVTTAPVKLSLSSMEQPIRAGTGFFVGMELKSMDGENSMIIPPIRVEVDIPREFVTGDVLKDPRKPCYGQATVEGDSIVWEIKEGEGFRENVLYCDFYPEEGSLVPDGSPSKTYYINARATYRFTKWEKKDAKLAFGSWCCGDKDCEKIGKVCVPSEPGELKGTCQKRGAVVEPESVGLCCFPNQPDIDCKAGYYRLKAGKYSTVEEFGKPGFCSEKESGRLGGKGVETGRCAMYEGQCSRDSDCDENPPIPDWGQPIACRPIEV